MKEPMKRKVAWRLWTRDVIFYIASLPGHDGADWGYTEKYDDAIPLNFYWQRRFEADCRRVGSIAHFVA